MIVSTLSVIIDLIFQGGLQFEKETIFSSYINGGDWRTPADIVELNC